MILKKYSRPAPLFNGEDNLSYYIRAVNQYPLLAENDEQEIVKLWIQEGSRQAGDILVNCHLRLVVKIAAGYEGYELPAADLIAEGNVGLLHSLQNFNPNMGARFATYATWWIHAQMKQYILQNWSLVKIGTTRAQKMLFFSFRRIKNKIQGQDRGALSDEQVHRIATDMGVPFHEVRSMEARLEKRDFSLNTPINYEDEDEGEALDGFEDDGPDPETLLVDKNMRVKRRILAYNLMCRLNERERSIIADRMLREKPLTLDDLGSKWGISRERVRQIENNALKKMQNHAKEDVNLRRTYGT